MYTHRLQQWSTNTDVYGKPVLDKSTSLQRQSCVCESPNAHWLWDCVELWKLMESLFLISVVLHLGSGCMIEFEKLLITNTLALFQVGIWLWLSVVFMVVSVSWIKDGVCQPNNLFFGCLSIVEKPVVFEVGVTEKPEKMPLTILAIDQLQSAHNGALGSKWGLSDMSS